MNPVLHSSKFHGHRTPEKILSRVRMIGPIGLDPCTQPDNPVGARMFITPDQGYPAGPLEPNEVIWINPPYGRALQHWTTVVVKDVLWCELANLYVHHILLVPARPDTKWWHGACLLADARCEIKGRLKFLTPEGVEQGPAPFPSALFYWGPTPEKFIEVFGDIGYAFLQR